MIFFSAKVNRHEYQIKVLPRTVVQTEDNVRGIEHQDTTMLNEVVVKASRQVSRLTADGIETRVQGTPLADVGTLHDLLGYLPMSSFSNGEISYAEGGERKLAVFIDGRRVYNKEELDQIPSSKIKNVEIITSPGAKYDSNIKAVVRVKTIKKPGDGFSLDNRAVAGFQSDIYVNDVLWLNYRRKALDIFSVLQYSFSKSKSDNNFSDNSAYPSGEYENKVFSHQNNYNRNYYGKFGFNYGFNPDHNIGFFYVVSHAPVKNISKASAKTALNGNLTGNTSTDAFKKGWRRRHIADAYYTGRWGRFDAEISLKACWIKDHDNGDFKETRVSGTKMEYYNDILEKSRLLAAKIDLSNELWKGSLQFGAEYTNTLRNNMTHTDITGISNNDDKVSEQNIGAYVQYSKDFGILSANIGCRYEHIASDYFLEGTKISECSRSYNEFLPSVTVTLPAGRTAFQLSYSRIYTRPDYDMLSSAIIYNNSGSYITGNPHLKSFYTNIAMMTFNWNWLTVIAGYGGTKGRFIEKVYPSPEVPDVMVKTFVNSPEMTHNTVIGAEIQPGKIAGFYYPTLSAQYAHQLYDTVFRDKPISLSGPTGIFDFKNIFLLPSDFRIFLDFYYSTGGYESNVKMNSEWSVGLGAMKKFGKAWELRLTAKDIFNTASHSRSTIYSGNTMETRDLHVPKRAIELSVSYHFNTAKSRYRGTGAGLNDMERL